MTPKLWALAALAAAAVLAWAFRYETIPVATRLQTKILAKTGTANF